MKETALFAALPRAGTKAGARAVTRLGGGLLALALSVPCLAATYVTVDGHPSPVTIAIGETVTVRFDTAAPKRSDQLVWVRDIHRTGAADPLAPFAARDSIQDQGPNDLDPAPGKVAVKIRFDAGTPAGPYVLLVYEFTNGRTVTVSLPVTLVPAPAPQAVSGRVAVVPAGGGMGTPLPDAIVWAMSGGQTPVASADVQPDGSYTLPLPPSTSVLRAEWFGNLRSQQQIVTVAAGQQVTNADLPLLVGQEVSGTLRDDHGQPLANAPVQAVAAGGATFGTQSFTDGSYVLALPAGSYTISARGVSQVVSVADEPLDGVDFPSPASRPAPAAGTIVTVAGNGIPGLGGDGRPAAAARLFMPDGLALDRAGNLYIAEDGAERVRRVDGMTGLISTVAGSTPLELLPGFFYQGPRGGFSGDGGPATAALLGYPQHVAVDGMGNLYISEYANGRVRKVDPNGIITTVAGNGQYGSSGDGGPAR